MNESKFKSLVEAIVGELFERLPDDTSLEIRKDGGFLRITYNNDWEYRYFGTTGKKYLTKPWCESEEEK